MLISSNFLYYNFSDGITLLIADVGADSKLIKSIGAKAIATTDLRKDLMKDSIGMDSKFFDLVIDEEEYLLRRLETLMANNTKNKVIIEQASLRLTLYNKLNYRASFLALVMIIFGFLLWYFKHQKYIDAETKWKGEKYLKLLDEE
ncbi:hypothetical protein [Zobellia nedashkovskayae]|uniref:hypothetical protein n=1 Tax=Zobellia nedashkovskayae TaxID=2779510 RepID=UPI00188B9878|nr:hypothetical protein [Zobellia nedashkovskayae]